MSVTIMAGPVTALDDVPCVGAVCDTCQGAVIPFDTVGFSATYLHDAIERHECGRIRRRVGVMTMVAFRGTMEPSSQTRGRPPAVRQHRWSEGLAAD